jgi:hypothetical protein
MGRVTSVMGRNMFGPVRGGWDRDWNGWWGGDPPFDLQQVGSRTAGLFTHVTYRVPS